MSFCTSLEHTGMQQENQNLNKINMEAESSKFFRDIENADKISNIAIVVFSLVFILAIYSANIDNPRNMLSEEGKMMLEKILKLFK